MNALVGRLLTALLFLGSFSNKLSTFGEDGGPTVGYMAPKIATAKAGVEAFAAGTLGFELSLPSVDNKVLLMVAMFLEGAGAVLYVTGSPLGAKMLMVFLLTVTPVMHDFWNSPEDPMEMIHFLKNLALFGSLLTFCSMTAAVKKTKSKMVKLKKSQ
jgi:uncharacterized membrane protein YphA (DoxX/SURF4 family)